MAAVATGGVNISYATGLYKKLYFGYAGSNTGYFDSSSPYAEAADPAPCSQSWSNGDYSALFIGYFQPTVSANTITLSISGSNSTNQNYVWIGNAAKSGYNAGNALFSSSGSGQGFINLVAGVYYPIRIQIGYRDDASFFQSSNLSMTLLINSSTSYGVFYNSATGGF